MNLDLVTPDELAEALESVVKTDELADVLAGLATLAELGPMKSQLTGLASAVAHHSESIVEIRDAVAALAPPAVADPPVVVALTGPALLSKNAVQDTYPKLTTELASAWGMTGPRATITAWSAPVYAPDRRKWYFFNGGHNDTGLNHVTEYDEATGLYTRLTDPSPLDQMGRPIYGPPMCHTRGGMKWYSTVTRCIYFAHMGEAFAFNQPPGWVWPGRELWKFDIDQLAWTRLADYPIDMTCVMASPSWLETVEGNLRVFVTTYSPQKRCAVGDFNPVTETWGAAKVVYGDMIWYGCGSYDPSDGMLWHHDANVWKLPTLEDGSPGVLTKIAGPAMSFGETDFWIAHGAYCYSWDQADHMLRLDKATGKWSVLFGLKLPLDSGFHGYNGLRVSDDGATFIVSCGENGFWSVPIPAEDAAWVPVEDVHVETAQSYIDAAAPGATVTIPPGYYRDALNITRAVDVHLDGVVLLGMVQEKAPVLVTTTDKVRIYDYECLGTGGDSTSAGLRDAGQDFDIEVYNAHISRCPNGILTGNSGNGKLLVDGGLIEKMTGDDKSHGIYFGRGASLTMRNVTIKGDGITQLFGHLYKSRSLATTLENCEGLGGDGRYSREIDIPCGGTVKIIGGTFHKGANSDNADHMSFAVEEGVNCTGPDGIDRCTLPGSIEYSASFTSDQPNTRFLTTHTTPTIDLTGAIIQAGVTLP